ncbi:DMT family transporter [Pseudidiomarina aestuarii]|nr:DMT family transporter [Pseudidiomarina aestuarii]
MKPYLYMVGYGLSQTIVWILVSYLSQSVAVTVMFLARNLVGFLLTFLFSANKALPLASFKRWKAHFFRASATLLGGLSIFYSVTKIPVADSVAITFLAPIFGTVLSIFYLGEKLTKATLFKLVVGFIGVFIITGFSAEGDAIGYAAALFGAFMTAVAYVSVKSLSDTESPQTILYVSYLVMVPISALLAIDGWVTPTNTQLLWLLAIGTAFYLAQIFMAKAFSLAPAAKVLPVDYSRIIFSSVLGFVFLNQSMTLSTYIGAAVILLTATLREKDIEKLSYRRIFKRP